MDWPNNKDGQLLERLERSGISFSKPHPIEFNVDFNHWPPSAEAVDSLRKRYGELELYEPGRVDGMEEGYISVRTQAQLSYEFITSMQKEITELVSQYGGYCNSWAVL